MMMTLIVVVAFGVLELFFLGLEVNRIANELFYIRRKYEQR